MILCKRDDGDYMNELYEMIEDRIAKSGYPGKIDGRDFYADICDEADDKENGTYMFLIKKDDNLSYQGCITIMDEEMDLHYVDIVAGNEKYHADFS